MKFTWCGMMHHNPWKHRRCGSCTLARRLFAAEDLVAKRGLTGPAAAAAAANLAALGPDILNLDRPPGRPR